MDNKTGRCVWLGLALLGVLLGGCTTLPQRLAGPTVQTHILALENLAPALAPVGPALIVTSPTARPGYDSARMVYVKRPYELSHFARNGWAAPPARMLQPLLVQALESSGRFSAVVAGPNNVVADVRLDTEILLLYQDFTTKPSRVRLALRTQMVDLRTRRVLATRTFQDAEPAPSDDPFGGVTASNRLLARMLEQVARFCAETAARGKGGKVGGGAGRLAPR